jgi:hypothetical protein
MCLVLLLEVYLFVYLFICLFIYLFVINLFINDLTILFSKKDVFFRNKGKGNVASSSSSGNIRNMNRGDDRRGVGLQLRNDFREKEVNDESSCC